jgi:membrane protease YdiL (CAAX protease family)
MRSSAPSPLLAPAWHTAALLLLLLSGPLLALCLPRAAPTHLPGGRLVGTYLPLLASEGLLVAFVWLLGLRPAGTRGRLLLGNWERRALPADLGWALLGVSLALAIEAVWPSPRVAALVPQSPMERAAWVAVALAAALAEEFVFRGYLQVQLEALTRSAGLALAGQAVLFGLAHGDRGLAPAVKIGLYGLGLGALARGRGSLRPGMLCHAALNLASGLLASAGSG